MSEQFTSYQEDITLLMFVSNSPGEVEVRRDDTVFDCRLADLRSDMLTLEKEPDEVLFLSEANTMQEALLLMDPFQSADNVLTQLSNF